MGKIKKILENELIGGTQSTDVYPVTSTKAVYDTSNKVLDDYIQHLKKTSTFAGIATPSTNPGTPDGPVFYLASEAGTYSNFNGISVADGEAVILLWNDGAWTKKTTGLATEQEIIYDVSARNGGVVFESLQALLSSSNLNTLIPTSVRHGGMSVRFIQGSEQSSDNEYIQARLMATSFTTDVTKWQVVDIKPTKNSKNLVESGGVFNSIKECNGKLLSANSTYKNADINLLTQMEWEQGSITPNGTTEVFVDYMVRSKTRFTVNSLIKIIVNDGYEIIYNINGSSTVVTKNSIVQLSGDCLFMLRRSDRNPITPETITPSDFGSVSVDGRMQENVIVIDYMGLAFNTALGIFDCLNYSTVQDKLYRNLSINDYNFYKEQTLYVNKVYLFKGERYVYNGTKLVPENEDIEERLRGIDGQTYYDLIWKSKNTEGASHVTFGEVHKGDVFKVSVKATESLGQSVFSCSFVKSPSDNTPISEPIRFGAVDISSERSGETTVTVDNETSCLRIWMGNGTEDIDVSVHLEKIDVDAQIPILESQISILKDQIKANFVPYNNIEWEEGGFDGAGDNATVTYSMKRSKDILHCSEGKQLFVWIKNGYEVVLWDSVDKQNYVLYNHFSVGLSSFRIGIRRNDQGDITEAIDSIVKINEFSPSNDSYTIKLAASDSEEIYKKKADIICDGINDQYYIQCSIANHNIPTKVLLYPGHYYITEVRDCPPNISGLYGHKVVFTSPSELAAASRSNFARVISIHGLLRSGIQREMNFESCIEFTQSCWDSIDENGAQVSVISNERRGTSAASSFNSFIQLENISFRGLDRHKPVCFVDGYYSSNMQISKVNVKSGSTEETFRAFTYIPNEENIAFRGTQGSPYGTNFIKNCLAWNVGIGYSIGGEHFVLEDCAACFSKLAFAFSCYDGHTQMEHNNLMIKCVCSQCMESIRFGRYGIPEDIDESQLTEEELKKLHSYQDIECYGLQFGESVFTTKGIEGYDDGTHPTLGFYEVHPDTWRGIFTMQGFNNIARGCKQLKITNLNLKIRGIADDRPKYQVPEFSTYYDETNNTWYEFINGVWTIQN